MYKGPRYGRFVEYLTELIFFSNGIGYIYPIYNVLLECAQY